MRSEDDYFGRRSFKGTWTQRGKRVILDFRGNEGHRGRIVYALRKGEVHMTGSHFLRGRKIGTGRGVLRPL